MYGKENTGAAAGAENRLAVGRSQQTVFLKQVEVLSLEFKS